MLNRKIRKHVDARKLKIVSTYSREKYKYSTVKETSPENLYLVQKIWAIGEVDVYNKRLF